MSKVKEVFGSKTQGVFELPFEMAIYVPSTQDVDNVISVDEMTKRVEEVRKYLAETFGGYTSGDVLGGFVASNDELVNEQVTKVTAFSTVEAFEKNKVKLLIQIGKWGQEWGQEAIGFEYEGDLFYVPQNYDSKDALKKAEGGSVDSENLDVKFTEGGSVDVSIANEILKQLGGVGRLVAMIGAYNFVAHKNGVSFKIKNQRANYIKITLTSADLYDLEIGRIRGSKYTVVTEEKGLYNDMLKPSIEKATGMYLSLEKGGAVELKVKVLIISDKDPLSTQLQKLTGDSWNMGDFEELEKGNINLIKHKETGELFAVITLRYFESTDKTVIEDELEYLKGKFGISAFIYEMEKGGTIVYQDGGIAKNEDFEMVVISKELNKDGGKFHRDRFLVSAKNIEEAKEIATNLWTKTFGDGSDLTIVEVMNGEKKYTEAEKWWGNDLSLNEQKEFAKKHLMSFEYNELLGNTAQYSKAGRRKKFITEIWEKEGSPKSVIKGIYSEGGTVDITESELKEHYDWYVDNLEEGQEPISYEIWKGEYSDDLAKIMKVDGGKIRSYEDEKDFVTTIDFRKSSSDIANLDKLPVHVQDLIKSAKTISSKGFSELLGYDESGKLLWSAHGSWWTAEEVEEHKQYNSDIKVGFNVDSVGSGVEGIQWSSRKEFEDGGSIDDKVTEAEKAYIEVMEKWNIGVLRDPDHPSLIVTRSGIQDAYKIANKAAKAIDPNFSDSRVKNSNQWYEKGGELLYAEGGEIEEVLWAVKKGEPDYMEQIITAKPEKIEEAKKWAEANGFDRFRIATVNMNKKPNFAKVVEKMADGGSVKCNCGACPDCNSGWGINLKW